MGVKGKVEVTNFTELNQTWKGSDSDWRRFCYICIRLFSLGSILTLYISFVFHGLKNHKFKFVSILQSSNFSNHDLYSNQFDSHELRQKQSLSKAPNFVIL